MTAPMLKMVKLIFRCTRTRMNVQIEMPEMAPTEHADSYESVTYVRRVPGSISSTRPPAGCWVTMQNRISATADNTVIDRARPLQLADVQSSGSAQALRPPAGTVIPLRTALPVLAPIEAPTQIRDTSQRPPRLRPDAQLSQACPLADRSFGFSGIVLRMMQGRTTRGPASPLIAINRQRRRCKQQSSCTNRVRVDLTP